MEIEEVRNVLKLVCPNGKIDIPLRAWESDRCNVWSSPAAENRR